MICPRCGEDPCGNHMRCSMEQILEDQAARPRLSPAPRDTLLSKPIPTDPELLALLERVFAMPPMTPAQIKEQRISFVYGQLMDCAPDVTKDQIRALDDEMYGRPE